MTYKEVSKVISIHVRGGKSLLLSSQKRDDSIVRTYTNLLVV